MDGLDEPSERYGSDGWGGVRGAVAVERELFGGWRGGDETPMRALIIIVGMSGFAGLINYCRTKRGFVNLSGLALSVAASAFVGVEAHFFMKALNVSYDMQFALSGILGYSSGAVLDAAFPILSRYVCKRLGIKEEAPRRRRTDFPERGIERSDEAAGEASQDEAAEEETG